MSRCGRCHSFQNFNTLSRSYCIRRENGKFRMKHLKMKRTGARSIPNSTFDSSNPYPRTSSSFRTYRSSISSASSYILFGQDFSPIEPPFTSRRMQTENQPPRTDDGTLEVGTLPPVTERVDTHPNNFSNYGDTALGSICDIHFLPNALSSQALHSLAEC